MSRAIERATEVEELPLWFGPSAEPLFGWIHQPAGDTCRAAVVVSPAMGQERDFSHYFLRRTAQDLADRGFLVIRFDYPGTGDSTGSELDPERVKAWTASIEHAIELARGLTSAPLVLAGLRIGALLSVGLAQQRDDVDGLLLLEVPRSGRSLLREIRLRQSAALGDEESADGSVTALGTTYPADAVRDLSAISVKSLTSLPCEHAMSMSKRGREGVAPGTVTRGGAPVDLVTTEDLEALLATEQMPVEARAQIAGWLDEHYATAYPMTPHVADENEHELVTDAAVERVRRLGPRGLFGIVCEPRERRTSTMVVFTPSAHLPHGGPLRMWPEIARGLAAQGIASVRFDVSGCGDSAPRPGNDGHQFGLPAHMEDVDDAVRAASPDPGDVVLVGLCSGGYLSLETALTVAPRGLALINPVFAFLTPENPPDALRRARQTTKPALYKLFGPVIAFLGPRISPQRKEARFEFWDRWLEACFWQSTLTRRFAAMPELLWTMLNAVLLRNRPAQTLQRVSDRGTHVLLIAGDPDWRNATLGSKRHLRRLSRRGRLTLTYLPSLDHSGFRIGQKELLMGHLERYVRSLLLDDQDAA